MLSGKFKGPGNTQASGNRNPAHVSKVQCSKTVRPTFYNIKADTTVKKVFKFLVSQPTIGVASSHTGGVIRLSY